MRSAAKALGIFGGVIGMIIGIFSFGYVSLTETHTEVGEVFGVVTNPGFIKAASFLGPILAITGAGMAKYRALWGGGLLLVSAVMMYAAFGFNFATMFPIGMAGVGGILAIAAGKPDEEKAHF